MPRSSVALGALLFAFACGDASRTKPAPAATPSPGARPDLLLVTLDTTRADHVAPEAPADTTPALAALAARAVRFTQAYATAPSTLPSHASMLTGLYPAGHGLHENGRRLADAVPLVTERLRELGYATAAFVSGFPLARQFGLARGFDRYDDAFGEGANERRADLTANAALAWLAATPADRPRFLWVHFYDAHDPYAPPEPFRSRFADDSYAGEIAFVDSEVGRLVSGFEKGAHEGGVRMLVVGDHGEGRGEHGEALHGNLLYQGVLRVPLLLAGDGIGPALRDDAVSVRQVMPTLLHWAVGEADGSLLAVTPQVVLAEAMQPFLNYRWQPQVMATDGRKKLIRSGAFEQYDLTADAAESRNLIPPAEPERTLARAIADYPLPSSGAPAPPPANDEERRRLASLGYLTSAGTPATVPANAPRAADMTRTYADLDAASRAFGAGDYAAAAPLLRRILAADPGNLMTAVRLAVSESFLGQRERADATFALARRIDPESIEVRLYLAQHLLASGRPREAAPLFEQVLVAQPGRAPALESLARIRAAEGNLPESAALLERAAPLSDRPQELLAELGRLRMTMADTAGATEAFERSRAVAPERFAHDLELGVLYLAARRLEEAREALDRVPPDHPGYPMALFKRAQVAVLLREPDASARIRAARDQSDATTRELIANERLFGGR
jgi:arylsulfatase A-like enzyme/tetratricopeptide (TPR) repeat protein